MLWGATALIFGTSTRGNLMVSGVRKTYSHKWTQSLVWKPTPAHCGHLKTPQKAEDFKLTSWLSG